MRFTTKLTKTARLERLLREEIDSRKLGPHDRFLSENEIVEKFGINQTTVRQTLGRLSADGILYRRHGEGTFVSPKARNNLVLVVARHAGVAQSSVRTATFDFMMGFQAATQSIASGFYPLLISKQQYDEQFQDIHLIYRNLAGIIFYSRPDSYIATRSFLLENNIPALYYGSDLNIEGHDELHAVVYPQARIVDLGLTHLVDKGHQRIGIIASKNGLAPRTQRLKLAQDWLQRQHLSADTPFVLDIDPEALANKDAWQATLHQAVREQHITGWFCVDDTLAQQSMNAAYRAGLRMPEDLAMVSVNNYALCERLICPLSSVEIPFVNDAGLCAEMLASLRMHAPATAMRRISDVRLVVRKSSASS